MSAMQLDELRTIWWSAQYQRGRNNNVLSNILIVLLVLFLIGTLPTWPHSANWGITLAVDWA